MSSVKRLAFFSVATIGLAGALVLLHAQVGQVQLVRVDFEGHKTPVGLLPPRTFSLRVSPDGNKIAYDTPNEIWVADLSNLQAARKLAAGYYPMWSADGEQIVYTVGPPNSVQTLYVRRADGTGELELIASGRAPESWSAQNQMMSFIYLDGYYNIWTYSLKDKKAKVLIDSPGVTEHSSKFSPDGKWIAYTSLETGQFEVFVRPYPLTGAKYRISMQGGGHPLWSLDGKQIIFENHRQLFTVSVQTTPAFAVGTPAALPIMGFVQGNARREFDLMPDGKQFLMLFR
jgi:Tol biopolymer transport system component